MTREPTLLPDPRLDSARPKHCHDGMPAIPHFRDPTGQRVVEEGRGAPRRSLAGWTARRLGRCAEIMAWGTLTAGLWGSPPAAIAAEDPPHITDFTGPRRLIAGRPARFQAKARGSEPIQFCWFKDGGPVSDTGDSILVIPSASVADSGRYRVEASNPFGRFVGPEIELVVQSLGLVFSDHFTDLDPFRNPGLGGGWVWSDDGHGPDPGLVLEEHVGLVRIPSAAGAGRSGGIQTTNLFPVGSRVRAIFAGWDLRQNDGSSNEDWPAGEPRLVTRISLVDSRNQKVTPDARNHGGFPALTIGTYTDGQRASILISRAGDEPGTEYVDETTVLDPFPERSHHQSLEIQVDETGGYEVKLGFRYNNGSGLPLRGRMPVPFGSNAFRLGISTQGLGDQQGLSLFDWVEIVAEESTLVIGTLDAVVDGEDLLLTWIGDGVLQVVCSP